MTDPARRHATLARPGLAGRTVGLAASFAFIAIAVVVIAVIYNARPAAATAAEDDTPPAPILGEDLDRLGERVEGMLIQLVDEDDPTRVVGVITAASFDPIDPANREVVEPRAEFLLDDGRTALIQADEGRFFIPPGTNQPEEGVLRGNARVRLFDPRPDGARPNPDADTPALDARFEQPLRFDLRLGEISTPGRLTVTGPQIDFAGAGVRAVLNEASQRIVLLEVERGDRLVYRPAEEPAAAAAARPSLAEHTLVSVQDTSGARTEKPDAPAIDLYRAVFRDGVVGEQAGRRIVADRLDVWARLVDRRFPDRAPTASTAATPATWTGTPVDILLAVALAQSDPSPAADPDNAPITLNWTGPLRLDLLDETNPPVELASDNLALRFTAERTGLVAFADDASGASGAAVAAEYAESTRRMLLTGAAGTVHLESPDAGRIEGVSRMAVAFDIGNVNVRGPGVLTAADHDGNNPDTGRRRAIRWTEQADFEFAVDDGRMTDRLTEARFLGRVAALADEAELRGSALTAVFLPNADDPNAAPKLRQLRIADAVGEDGRGGSLAGDDMRVAFDPRASTDDALPTGVAVTGNVRAARDDGATITADNLDAGLERDRDDRLVVDRVEARGNVAFSDGRDLAANADTLNAAPQDERVTLEGEGSTVRRGSSAVAGPRIELDGRRGTLVVRGPGTIADLRDDPGVRRRVDLAWSSFLEFNDDAGNAVIEGRVSGTLEGIEDNGALARDTLRTERVTVELTPRDAAAEDATIGERIRAITVRGATTDDGPADARVEARRYAVPTDDADQAPLERLLALEGPEITLLASEERVVVPGPGRLVSVQNPEADDASLEAGDRVLVEWLGGLTLDRPSGAADLFNRVQVVHFRPDAGTTTGTTTELEAETLRLVYRDREERAGELVALDAAGAAWLRSGTREMLADRILYNADTGIARATAEQHNEVTLFDGERGTSVRASTLEWDLFRDTITFDRPGGVTAPR